MGAPAQALDSNPGRYEIQAELARGGMGAVYRAVDRVTGKVLALKRGLATSGESAALLRTMLEREYRTLCALRHPYIIEVFDFGIDELGPFYTMELLDGADLRARCPMPWREMCGYLREIASSLALLHSRRLLHCDVSVANIRLTSEGRARLIDFGTLAKFGRNTMIAGSPPTTSPEAMRAEELDQRADLYALGASAYYALTGRHAYPASTLAVLPALWAGGRPAPPSSYAADVPAELDQLVLALLEQDRQLRPNSAAEVIDKLEAIAGLTPDRDPRVLRSYLNSSVVVGRDAPRRLLSDKLKHALAGRRAGVLIEGASGLGKSFLVDDLAQEARVAGARVLSVHARAHPGELGVWAALLREAGVEVRREKGDAQTAAAESALLELSAQAPIVIILEDLQEADTDSLAAFARLAKSGSRSRLLLIATLDSSHAQADRPAMELLRARFSSLKLAPFDEKATHDFVVGLFGEVPSAASLAAFLHEHAAGNPQTYRAVIDHLIEVGLIRYADGIWVLPTEFPVVGPGGLELGALVDGALERRIAHWKAPLRCLAQCLSPNRRAFDGELCAALAAGAQELADQHVSELIGELVREGVLVDEQGSYTFCRKADQQFFYGRLSPAQKQRQHLILGEQLAERFGADAQRTFEIGFHFLCAGELKKARRHLNKNVEAALRDPDMLIQAVPDLWALLEHQRAAGASDEEVQFIEGMLVLAGYYVDPTVYDKFGERVLRVMHRTLGFALASRLAPWLGRPLALAVGMLVAAVRGLFRQHLVNGGSFAASVLTFIGVCVSMNAGACSRFDHKVTPLLRELLDVTSTLGRFNALRFLYDQFMMSEDFLQGRYTKGEAGLFDQLERLPRLPLLAGESEHQLWVGLSFGVALKDLLRAGSKALPLADEMEAIGGRYDRLQAQFLRVQYHLFRGDIVAARREEQLYDEMSAQFSSRWVKDVAAATEFAPYHLTADVLGLKRVLHRIELLMPVIPELATKHEIVQALYQGHRGRPDLALRQYAELGDRIAPFADGSWATAAGHKAECLNSLGRHAEALAFCEQMRQAAAEEDRSFVFIYQQLERESALALAGLGRLDEAVALADKLLAECGEEANPLIRGLLHLDRARIAHRADDAEAFDRHVQAAKEILTATHNPAAIARVKRVVDARRGDALGSHYESSDASVSAINQLADPLRRKKAARVLDEIVATVQARSAHLYLLVYGKAVLCAQHGGQRPDDSLTTQLSKLAGSLEGERREPVISQVLGQVPTELTHTGRLVPLVAAVDEGQSQLVALLALGECEHPEAIGHLDLPLFASELLEVDEATEVCAES